MVEEVTDRIGMTLRATSTSTVPARMSILAVEVEAFIVVVATAVGIRLRRIAMPRGIAVEGVRSRTTLRVESGITCVITTTIGTHMRNNTIAHQRVIEAITKIEDGGEE